MSGLRFAPWQEVRGWLLVSSLVAGTMLCGVLIAAMVLPADPSAGAGSLLLDHAGFSTALTVFKRNLLVLAIHALAATAGGIIGRKHKPLPGHLNKLHLLEDELPAWVARGTMLYALSATLLSVALQTTGLGFQLADLSGYLHTSPVLLLIAVLPHAIPELIGVFLPLGLFLIQARRDQLEPLNRWTWQAVILALPLIFVAALIEGFSTPHLINTLFR